MGYRQPDAFDNEVVRNTDIMMNFGWQTLGEHISFEIVSGIGARFINQSRQDVGQDSSNQYGSVIQDVKGKRLRFDFAMKIGYYF